MVLWFVCWLFLFVSCSFFLNNAFALVRFGKGVSNTIPSRTLQSRFFSLSLSLSGGIQYKLQLFVKFVIHFTWQHGRTQCPGESGVKTPLHHLSFCILCKGNDVFTVGKYVSGCRGYLRVVVRVAKILIKILHANLMHSVLMS